MDTDYTKLTKLAKLIRYYILTSTTAAGSGHATSALSAVEMATMLFFKYLRADLEHPEDPANDRFILSKGHASPLLYSLYAAAGKISETDILKLRKFNSPLEGHPTVRFKYTEAPTGSLGQGLSVGLGMAIALRKLAADSEQQTVILPKIYVLLGDGEMTDGQVWEAVQLAVHYKLNNLIALIDVNRLEQTQQTMYGHNPHAFAQRLAAFGWRTYVVTDGHDLGLLDKAFELAIGQSKTPPNPLFIKEGGTSGSEMPAAIIAKTIKGKGVSLVEDKNGWHGIALSSEKLIEALKELGEVDKVVKGMIQKPNFAVIPAPYVIPAKAGIYGVNSSGNLRSPIRLASLKLWRSGSGMTESIVPFTVYKVGEKVATRKAYGTGLVRLGKMYSDIVALDAGVRNSTYAEIFTKELPERYFEMFIAEQNMVSAAVGMERRGLTPFVSTFSCFLMRSADQIRMAELSGGHIIFCGSHGGVSIGKDGPSQMGLQEVALFRSLLHSTVLYASDAVAMERLLEEAYKQPGLVYLQTIRPATPVIYAGDERFPIGQSKTLRGSANNSVTVIACGITVIEAIKAADLLKQQGVTIRVIDCYSIKPIDTAAIIKAATETKAIITVEDHYPVGGLGDAVLEALADKPKVPIYKLAVYQTPRSGKPDELLEFEQISAAAIIHKVKQLI